METEKLKQHPVTNQWVRLQVGGVLFEFFCQIPTYQQRANTCKGLYACTVYD